MCIGNCRGSQSSKGSIEKLSGAPYIIRINDLRRSLAEEIAHEYPTPSSAIGLVNHLIELGDRIVMDRRSVSTEDRLRYRAMYHRLRELAPERVKGITFYDFPLYDPPSEDEEY